MKKTLFGLVTVLLALGLVLASCSNDFVSPLEEMARKAKGEEINLTDTQKALAKEVLPFESTRTNASGPKIPSNAHSADFPGLYFYWADKQKAEECFLLVKVGVFDEYKGFLLTKKVSNTYWDYAIGKASEENIVTANGEDWYLYKIPSGKAYYVWEAGEDEESVAVLRDHELKQNGNGSFNINMVFISEWEEQGKEFSQMMDDPLLSEKYVISFTKEVYEADGVTLVPVLEWKDSDKFIFDLIDGVKADGTDNVITSQTLTKNSPTAPEVIFEVDKNGSYTVKERAVSGYEKADILSVAPTVQKKTISIISKANNNAEFGTFEVNSQAPTVKWTGGTVDKPLYEPDIKTFWGNGVRASSPAAYDDMLSLGPEDGPNKLTWIWDREDSWSWGTTGSEIIHYLTTFDLSEDDYLGIVMRDGESDVANNKYAVPIYFACDNVAVLFVNGEMVAYTTEALKGRDVPDYGETFEDLSYNSFDGNKWQQIYFADIYPKLVAGPNKIEFYAANSEYVEGDTPNNDYHITNNPCGIIFACAINIEKEIGEGIDKVLQNVREQEYYVGGKNGTQSEWDSTTGANPGNYLRWSLDKNWFTYIDLAGLDLEAGFMIDILNGDKLEKVGQAFVQLVNGKLEITIQGNLTRTDKKTGNLDGSLVAKLFSTAPTSNPQSGNGGVEVKAKSVSITYSGEPFLYIHADGFSFYKW